MSRLVTIIGSDSEAYAALPPWTRATDEILSALVSGQAVTRYALEERIRTACEEALKNEEATVRLLESEVVIRGRKIHMLMKRLKAAWGTIPEGQPMRAAYEIVREALWLP